MPSVSRGSRPAPRRRPERGPRGSVSEPEVRAAGGLVVRDGEGGPEVAVVHRPKYDDWSLPKGKLDPGETWEVAALREVAEETGVRCELERELTPARYRDGRGRDKLVRWWLMRPIGDDGFTPGREIDELRWLAPNDAVAQLDYEHDRELVRSVRG
jgi:8-oxo-dGTP pyrophosphatase MutT (NUDIX family)